MAEREIAVEWWNKTPIVMRAAFIGGLLAIWTALNSIVTFGVWNAAKTNQQWIIRHEGRIESIDNTQDLKDSLEEIKGILLVISETQQRKKEGSATDDAIGMQGSDQQRD